jgi:hypothetical protein
MISGKTFKAAKSFGLKMNKRIILPKIEKFI